MYRNNVESGQIVRPLSTLFRYIHYAFSSNGGESR